MDVVFLAAVQRLALDFDTSIKMTRVWPNDWSKSIFATNSSKSQQRLVHLLIYSFDKFVIVFCIIRHVNFCNGRLDELVVEASLRRISGGTTLVASQIIFQKSDSLTCALASCFPLFSTGVLKQNLLFQSKVSQL